MMKHEFEELIGVEIPGDDYDEVEYVYMWYPSNMSKEQIADTYKIYGMAVIRDMLPRAIECNELNRKKDDLNKQIREISNRLIDLADGKEQ